MFLAARKVKWISTRKSTRHGLMCHLISGCGPLTEQRTLYNAKNHAKFSKILVETARRADLHVMHIVAYFLSIFLFKENTLPAKSYDLRFSLALLNQDSLCRAGTPASRSAIR